MNSSDKDIFARNILYWGVDNQKKLTNLHVAVFGLGGVGGFCVEALARAGVGELTIIDFDEVSHSNINRQIVAMHSTVEQNKARLFEQRLKDINPDIKLHVIDDFYTEGWDMPQFDFVADAIDTVTCKLGLVEECRDKGIPIISAMGCGNKLDPTRFRVADICDTRVCPLCRVMRRELKKRNISGLTVVYSEEPPRTPLGVPVTPLPGQRTAPGSLSFVPAAAGLILAGEIIRRLSGVK